MKRIRETIKENEYLKLMDTLRKSQRENKIVLQRVFTFLYYSGVRLNEIRLLKNSDILKLLEDGEIIIGMSKVQKERKIYLGKNFKSDLLETAKVSELKQNPNNFFFTSKRKSNFSEKGFIQTVNKFIKDTLGDRYSSHSFRSGLITHLSQKSVSPKFIKDY